MSVLTPIQTILFYMLKVCSIFILPRIGRMLNHFSCKWVRNWVTKIRSFIPECRICIKYACPWTSLVIIWVRVQFICAFGSWLFYVYKSRIDGDITEAGKLGIDSDKVGAMGFSAGGHLAMSGAALLPKAERPSFVASLYPVVTMTDSCVHKRSRRALLGENRKNNKGLRHLLSLEHHVPADCPPVFLVNCTDDPTVNCHNSELLDSALSLKSIPHKYIQYKSGGHGFGASDTKGTAESRQWKSEFIRWIKTLYK